jgi:hypothetical protein
MIKYAILFLASIVAGALAFAGIERVAAAQDAPAVEVAPADPGPATPDPVTAPAAYASTVRDLWRSGHIPAAVILGLFGALAYLRAKVGWFAKGRQAVFVAAALGTLAMLVAEAAGGDTPTLKMFAGALVTGVALYLRSEAVAQPPLKSVP